MTVTLRKAYSYSQALINAAQKLSLSATFEVSVYDEEIGATIDRETKALAARVVLVDALFVAGYALRERIGALHNSTGINSLLTKKAHLDALEKSLSKLQGAERHDVRATGLKVISARKRLDESGYSSDTVTASMASDDLVIGVEARLREIRREKVRIKDSLEAINHTSHLALTADEERLLTEIGVL